ncbi:MAG: hypothetical protein IPH27_16525 [Actinomycetales bacterium]|nr:hypothetical protein [Candidatus Phosphoribacter baldrii]
MNETFVSFARLMAVIEQTALIAVPNDYQEVLLESDVLNLVGPGRLAQPGYRVGGDRRPGP